MSHVKPEYGVAAGIALLTKQLMINPTGNLTKSATNSSHQTKPPTEVKKNNQPTDTMPLAYYKPAVVVNTADNETVISTLV